MRLDRFSCYFGTTPQFWTNLQTNYDLELPENARDVEIAGRIRPHRAAEALPPLACPAAMDGPLSVIAGPAPPGAKQIPIIAASNRLSPLLAPRAVNAQNRRWLGLTG